LGGLGCVRSGRKVQKRGPQNQESYLLAEARQERKKIILVRPTKREQLEGSEYQGESHRGQRKVAVLRRKQKKGRELIVHDQRTETGGEEGHQKLKVLDHRFVYPGRGKAI